MRERRETVAQVCEEPDAGCVPTAVEEFVGGVVEEGSRCVGRLVRD